DVNERRVAYLLRNDVNDTNDAFSFSVVDAGENRMSTQVFRLEWSWVSLAKAEFEVNETTSDLHVTLRRRGFLGHTAFVTLQLWNDTASVEEDLHRSYARQVQFNPGQRSAEWRARVVDDALFEGTEYLTLTLRYPVMTALESPLQALIIIRDDEDVSHVEFDVGKSHVEEDAGEVELRLVRRGDASHELVVACTTHTTPHHGSATGTVPTTVLSYSDYISRPDGPASMVRFGDGEREAVCKVVIIDDSLHEDEESFSVFLSSPMGGVLGATTNVTVTILPD
ncbi:hypothetical protein OTU49_006692, partial [Cherax quadricarinatus]